MTHLFFPRARPSTRKFHLLSYHDPKTNKYALGWDDFYMVMYSIIVLTGLRAATMDFALVPLAQVLGIGRKKDKIRFAEQAWILIYDSAMWTIGVVHCLVPSEIRFSVLTTFSISCTIMNIGSISADYGRVGPIESWRAP